MMKYMIVVVLILLVAACGVFADSAGSTVSYYHELILDGENPSALPAWILSVEQEHGVWLEQPNRWVAEKTLPDGQGRILISIDREKLHADVGMALICKGDHDADIAVQLLDKDGRVIAVDLVGNAIPVGDETQTDTFAIPLRKHPTATRLAIQRITGHITISGVVLFPLVIGDAKETDLETQIEILKLLTQSLSPDSPTLQMIKQIMSEKKPTEVHADAPPSKHVTAGPASSPHGNAFEPGRFNSNNSPQLPNASTTVGIDLHHGMIWKDGVELIRTNGYQPVLIESAITPAALKDLAVLIIVTDGLELMNFDEAEVKAIVDFVGKGGGLLCAAQAWSWNYKAYGNRPVDDYPLNSLGRTFGFKITGENINAPAYADLPFVENVNDVVHNDWQPSRILFNRKSAHPFIRDGALRAMAGSLEYERGRIVVLGHGSMPARNPKLMTNILLYLSGSASW